MSPASHQLAAPSRTKPPAPQGRTPGQAIRNSLLPAWNTTKRLWLPASILANILISSPATAQHGVVTEPPDLENWTCRYCPEAGIQQQLSLHTGLAAGFDQDLRFAGAELDGLDQAQQIWLGGQLRHRDPLGFSLHAEVHGLGLDEPRLQLDGGRQGHYRLALNYRELNYRSRNSGHSPYQGMGSASLQLPASWVSAGRTQDMSALPALLKPYQAGHERRRLQLDAAWTPAPRWAFALDLDHETRRGSRFLTGAFLTQSSYLPAPIDDRSEQLRLQGQWLGEHWATSLSYTGARYANQFDALRWDHPFSPLTPDAAQGQLALPPGNQSHQLQLTGQFFGMPKWQASAMLGLGRMSQDESLLPVALNPTLASALPRTSAAAQVDTHSAFLRLNYRPRRAVRLKLQYRLHAHDNSTPRQVFTPVLAESQATAQRTNTNPSHRDQQLKLEMDQRLHAQARLQLGLTQKLRRREDQARRRSNEYKLWSRLSLRPRTGASFSTEVSAARRRGSAFEPLGPDQPPQNAYQRAFNLADRERLHSVMRLQLPIALAPGSHLGIQAEYISEDFQASSLGLRAASQAHLNTDWATQWGGYALRLFGSLDEVRFEQAGSSTFAEADWRADSRDLIQAAGLSVERAGLLPRTDLQLNYQYSHGRGAIRLAQRQGPSDFPLLRTRLHALALNARHHWRPNLDLNLYYRFERFNDEDWQQHGLAVDSLPGVLGPGQDAANSARHAVAVAADYRF